MRVARRRAVRGGHRQSDRLHAQRDEPVDDDALQVLVRAVQVVNQQQDGLSARQFAQGVNQARRQMPRLRVLAPLVQRVLQGRGGFACVVGEALQQVHQGQVRRLGGVPATPSLGDHNALRDGEAVQLAQDRAAPCALLAQNQQRTPAPTRLRQPLRQRRARLTHRQNLPHGRHRLPFRQDRRSYRYDRRS